MHPRIQVLVVDDEKDLCVLTKAFLEMSGDITVDTVTSVKKARAALANSNYDAVISDYQMPQEDGIQFLKSMRLVGDRTPFILFTGKGREDVVIEALNNGADSYLQKGGMQRPQYIELEHRVRAVVRRHRAEEALRESEHRYRLMADNIADVVSIMDLDLHFTYLSPSVKGLRGVTAEEALDQTLDQVLTKESLQLVRIMLAREAEVEAAGNADPNRTLYVELEEFRKDGTRIWVSNSLSYIRDENGQAIAILDLSHDITERKRAEEALRESEERFRKLAELLPETIFEVDLEGKVTYWNQRAYGMFGPAADESAGSVAALDMLTPDDRERGMMNFQRVLQGEDIGAVEYEMRRPDGRTFSALVSATTVLDRGTIAGLRGVVIDISAHKLAEEALQEANRKLNLLSSITRHDINNQLILLRGHLALMDRESQSLVSKDHLRKAEAAAGRVSAMIEFTKEYEDIGVEAAVWQAVRDLIVSGAELIPLGAVELVNDVPPDIEVFADPLIAKVFSNLIDNAIRHGGPLTHIRFHIEEGDDHRRIICQDDGQGIPSNMKENIFTHGYGRNTGLGLFLSKEILAITGISIAEMGEQGRGARFVLTVPERGLRSIGDDR